MIKGYVSKGERPLFVTSLLFSLLVYGLIAAGAVAFKASMDESRAALAAAWDDEPADEAWYDDPAIEAEDDAYSIDPEEMFADTLSEYGLGDEGMSEDDYYEDGFDPDAFPDGNYGLAASSLGLASLSAAAGIMLFYVVAIALVLLAAHIVAVGHLMGNGVRVSERQFPELWAVYGRAATELGVKRLPAFYLVESGGMLNAFATRLFTRNYVAIYADLAERLYEGDEASVAFVLAHELVHVKRNHVLKGLLTLPAEILPFLKPAWRRACEYTCDAGGAAFAGEGAEKGLVLLAAGKKLAARMDADAYLESFYAEKSAWKRLAELVASHPHLPKRIAALRRRAAAR